MVSQNYKHKHWLYSSPVLLNTKAIESFTKKRVTLRVQEELNVFLVNCFTELSTWDKKKFCWADLKESMTVNLISEYYYKNQSDERRLN